MTYRPRRRCKICGADRDDCGGVSRTGLCGPCGLARFTANLRQLRAGCGPYWLAWRDGITEGVARLWEVGAPEDCGIPTNGEPVSGVTVGGNLQESGAGLREP